MKASTILAHCVPFPAPGPPRTKTTLGFSPEEEDILEEADARWRTKTRGAVAAAAADAARGWSGAAAVVMCLARAEELREQEDQSV